MAGFWQINNRGAAGVAATATQSAPTNATAVGGFVLRLRSFTATLSGGSAGTDQLVVRDGASGTGTIIFTADLAVAANGTAVVSPSSAVDLRASVGNALTIEFVNGVAADRENVNAEGDWVPLGWPVGQP